tara:strand:+ start:94 stop:498 length:405 start_codon:yes stop_codon:yes gene_type:complete
LHPAIPYVFRAILAWISDENHTPYIVAVTDKTGIQIPPGAARENYITLNIGPDAVRDFEINDEFVAFNARFAGVAREVVIPLDAIHMIYAFETQAGVMIKDGRVIELTPSSPAEFSAKGSKDKKKPVPNLKLVE